MAVCIHHLALTVPQSLTAADLPQLCADLFSIPNLDPLAVRQSKGRHGYRECYSLKDAAGKELIAVMLDGRGTVANTSHFTIHGAAWDAGEIDAPTVCREVIARKGWATEIHLAMDDTDEILPWTTIRELSTSSRWDKDITTTLCRTQAPTLTTSADGTTLYFGTRKSDTTVAMYDRRGPLRVEYRTHTRAGATDLMQRLAAGEDLAAVTAGVLARVLRFHAAGSGRKDHRPVAAYWENFLGSAKPIKLARHRDAGHRSPWYVPPTKADKVQRFITRHLTGDASDAQLMEMLREIVQDADAKKRMAEEWEPGTTPVINQSPIPETLVTHIAVSHDFAPDIRFD